MNRFTLLALFPWFVGFSQPDSISVCNQLKKHVTYLASDELKGRKTGSPEEKIANNYIQSYLRKNRKVRLYKWEYSLQLDSQRVESTMMGFYINKKSDSTLLLGAHIDHLGYGGKHSMAPGKNEIHNGADDNASGVAVQMELFNYFVNHPCRYNILFVPFTGHEVGTFGSSYLSRHIPKKIKPLGFVINLDMVGRMDEKESVFWYNQQNVSPRLLNEKTSIQWKESSKNKLPLLDTKHFLDEEFPIITITSGMHLDYHKPSDDVEHLSIRGMWYLVKNLSSWVEK